MTDHARILGLMALKERAAIAASQSRVGSLARALAEAQGMAERLRRMVDSRAQSAPAERLATDIRADRHLTAQLLAEADRQTARIGELTALLAEAQAELARQEHRLQTLDDKASTARRRAQEERQARADAMLPPRPSRG